MFQSSCVARCLFSCRVVVGCWARSLHSHIAREHISMCVAQRHTHTHLVHTFFYDLWASVFGCCFFFHLSRISNHRFFYMCILRNVNRHDKFMRMDLWLVGWGDHFGAFVCATTWQSAYCRCCCFNYSRKKYTLHTGFSVICVCLRFPRQCALIPIIKYHCSFSDHTEKSSKKINPFEWSRRTKWERKKICVFDWM